MCMSAIVKPQGRLDVLSYRQCLQEITHLVEAGHKELKVDLQDVKFVDSSGLASLVRGYKLARQAGCSFSVVGVRHESVIMFFEIVRIAQLFPVEYIKE